MITRCIWAGWQEPNYIGGLAIGDIALRGGYMVTFILLSKISPTAASVMSDLVEMDTILEQELAQELPEVNRLASYALLGPYDFMHVIEAPDAIAAAKVALLVNRFGNANTQTLTAIPFEEFKQVAQDLNRMTVARP